MESGIAVEKMGQRGNGYKILPSWKRPSGKVLSAMDAWIPGLAPSYVLRKRLTLGLLTQKEFQAAYEKELRSSYALNLMKPLALLSLRRKLVLLCDCNSKVLSTSGCPSYVLAKVLSSLRKKRDFSLQNLFPIEKVSHFVAIDDIVKAPQ